MAKPKIRCDVVDSGKCCQESQDDFQAKSDFTYLKKSVRDGVRKDEMADSLLDKNCMEFRPQP